MKDKKRTTEELSAQIRAIAESALDVIGDGISIQGADFTVLYQNQAHRNLIGDHVGEYCYKAYENREHICEGCPVAKCFEDGKVHFAERSSAVEGRGSHVEITASPLRDSSGNIIAGIEAVRDITWRKSAEEALRFERAQLLSIFDSINEVIYVSDPFTYEILYVNKTVVELFKKNPVGGKCYREFQGRETPCEFCTNEIILKEKGKPYQWEYHNPVVNRDYLIVDRIIKWPDGRDVRFELAMDVTERKVAEERFRKAFNLAPYPMTISTIEEGRFLEVNDGFLGFTGFSREEAVGKTTFDLGLWINPEDRERMKRMLKEQGRVKGFEVDIRVKSGEVRNGLFSGETIEIGGEKYLLAVLIDITERKKLETELLKAEKLESLSILAGGIAHDFNNILTAVIGNLTLAKMYAQPGFEIHDILLEAEKASMMAKDLTQQLLTFSKGGAPVKRIISMKKLIKDAAHFSFRGSSVRCEFSIPDSLFNAEVDEGQVFQALNNILINAQQSMPEGGVVKISAENIALREGQMPPLGEGKYVKVSVKDEGIGIPEVHLGKIFDPFFTTKQKGSGLGLTSAYSIIRRHGGHIEVASRLGAGTVFDIYLPASEKEEAAHRKVGDKSPTGKGTVLVMDDEEIVRVVMGRMLAQCGYEADYAKDGVEAIELYKRAKESGRPFAAVIMDLIIPGGMGGREAIGKLLEYDPDAKVIVSSGYYDDSVMSDFRRFGFKEALAKPYEIEDLCRALHNVIVR